MVELGLGLGLRGQLYLSQSCLVLKVRPQGNALRENAQKKCENCRKVSIHLNCKFPVSIAIGKMYFFFALVFAGEVGVLFGFGPSVVR